MDNPLPTRSCHVHLTLQLYARYPQQVDSRLDPNEWANSWRRLGKELFDVVVIGGITGSGVALYAATRGLRVALAEARDLASGTSSRSRKLFHGGLQYLEQLEFRLVREALRERELMLTRISAFFDLEPRTSSPSHATSCQKIR
jgi:FAD dependent oxidoreductase